MNSKHYKLTVSDIAAAAGISEARVRYAIRIGKLVPSSLRELSTYVVTHVLDDKK
jgi:hypothetical protein